MHVLHILMHTSQTISTFKLRCECMESSIDLKVWKPLLFEKWVSRPLIITLTLKIVIIFYLHALFQNFLLALDFWSSGNVIFPFGENGFTTKLPIFWVYRIIFLQAPPHMLRMNFLTADLKDKSMRGWTGRKNQNFDFFKPSIKPFVF